MRAGRLSRHCSQSPSSRFISFSLCSPHHPNHHPPPPPPPSSSHSLQSTALRASSCASVTASCPSTAKQPRCCRAPAVSPTLQTSHPYAQTVFAYIFLSHQNGCNLRRAEPPPLPPPPATPSPPQGLNQTHMRELMMGDVSSSVQVAIGA